MTIIADKAQGLEQDRKFFIVLAFMLAGVFVYRCLALYLGAGHDDVFISLWSGKTLATHPWFANVNGEAEDMMSSPFFGALAWVCVSLSPASPLAVIKLFGLAAGAACVLLTYWLAGAFLGETRNRTQRVLRLGAAASVALTPSFEYWTMGGMETVFYALYTLLTVGAAIAYFENPSLRGKLLLAVALAFAPLIRVEGAWIAMAMAGLLPLIEIAVSHRPAKLALRDAALVTAPSLLIFAATCLGRLHFTGALWPNPVYAKGGEVLDLVELGGRYIFGFAGSSPLLFVLTIAPYIVVFLALRTQIFRANRKLVLIAAAIVILYDLFIVFSGGNWMTHFRFAVTTIPLKAILLAVLIATMDFSRLVLRMAMIPYVLAIAILPWQCGDNPNYPIPSNSRPTPLSTLNLGSLSGLQAQMIESSQIYRRDSTSIKLFVETRLKPIVDHLGGKVCFATYQAGYFPWVLRDRFSPEQVYVIDTMGLNNRLMAKRSTAKSSVGVIDGARIDILVKDQNKELFSLCGGKKPDLIYILWANDEVIQKYIEEGYSVIWKDAGAVVFSI